MKTLICSDIHDHVYNLENVLNVASTSNCDSLIICGDLCSPFIIDIIHQNLILPVHIIFGNNDGDQFNILKKCSAVNLKRNNNQQIEIHGQYLIKNKGSVLCGIPDTVSFAVYHYPDPAKSAFKSGDFDYVFFGHTHIPILEVSNNNHLANPGSVMGYIPSSKIKEAKPTCLIIDWTNNESDLIEL